jgi:hypothetical protein
MADERARDIYLAIGHAAPLTIADDYKLAKLAGDNSRMLALETHMRDLARLHFHRPDVREALRQLERTKSERRPGNGGTKMLHGIADQLERDYAAGAFEILADGRIRFTIGNLRLTCADRPGAVAWLAAKYRRGYRRPE